jgi:hypothetical protein
MIAAALAEMGVDSPQIAVSLVGVAALPACGTNDEVLQYHGLDVPSLTRAIEAAAERRSHAAPNLA